MSPLGARISASSPQCCENCVCGESCPGCPSYSPLKAMWAAASRKLRRGGRSGFSDAGTLWSTNPMTFVRSDNAGFAPGTLPTKKPTSYLTWAIAGGGALALAFLLFRKS